MLCALNYFANFAAAKGAQLLPAICDYNFEEEKGSGMMRNCLKSAKLFGIAMLMLAAVSCGKRPAASGESAPDPEAPVISVKCGRVQAFGGKTPSYDTLVDLSGSRHPAKLTIDTQAVNLNVTGTYPVTYTATDSAGRSTKLSLNIDVYAPKQRVAFLTFDDGPSVNTPEILNILKRYGVKATFFVIGQHKKYYPYITCAHDAGHTVAAHSFSHDYNIYRSADTYFADLEQIEALIRRYTGSRSPFVRMPGGSSNHMFRRYHPDNRNFMHQLVDELERRGYLNTDWTTAGQDAQGHNVPVRAIVDGALNSDESHSQYLCLLFHDSADKQTTVQALPAVIEGLKARGYAFAALTPAAPRFQHLKPNTRIE